MWHMRKVWLSGLRLYWLLPLVLQMGACLLIWVLLRSLRSTVHWLLPLQVRVSGLRSTGQRVERSL
jgi:hypothetical protein